MNANTARNLTKKFWDDLVYTAVREAATVGHTATTVTRPWLTSMQIMRIRPPMYVINKWRLLGYSVEVREESIAINWD